MSRPDWWKRVVDGVDAYGLKEPENLPGAVMGVETPGDGRLVDSVGEGWSRDTICEIGSMTKPFVSAAVLTCLEEHSLLDIEIPVHHLPGMEPFAKDPVKRQIRLRHLLQHTSGLPHFLHYTEWPSTPCNNPNGQPPSCGGESALGPTSAWIGAPSFTNECVRVGDRCIPAREVALDDVSRYIMETYPTAESSPPGTEYSYSTVNYILAARIVEKLSGQSVNRYIKERILEPLEMTDSFFIAQDTLDPDVDSRQSEGVTEEQRSRVADLTIITRDGKLPAELSPGPEGVIDQLRKGWKFVYADGGMYSTVNDLLNFLVMLREGGLFGVRRVLSPEVIRLLREDQGHGHTMGFGYRSKVTPYGQGAGTVEHMGIKMTYFWYDPRPGNHLIGVFLSQRLPNPGVFANMGVGMHVMFRIFVPSVKAEVLGAAVGATTLEGRPPYDPQVDA